MLYFCYIREMEKLKEELQQAALEVAAAKRALARAEAKFDHLMNRITGTTPAEAPPAEDHSYTYSILLTLESDRKKEWTPAEIQAKNIDIPEATLRALLYRLESDGKAVRTGRGKWKFKQKP
jgi:hypothetical protein